MNGLPAEDHTQEGHRDLEIGLLDGYGDRSRETGVAGQRILTGLSVDLDGDDQLGGIIGLEILADTFGNLVAGRWVEGAVHHAFLGGIAQCDILDHKLAQVDDARQKDEDDHNDQAKFDQTLAFETIYTKRPFYFHSESDQALTISNRTWSGAARLNPLLYIVIVVFRFVM